VVAARHPARARGFKALAGILQVRSPRFASDRRPRRRDFAEDRVGAAFGVTLYDRDATDR
jgi:hypothetical protein